MHHLLRKSLCFTLALTFIAVQTTQAQQTTPSAPIPSQIAEAHTVFISNAGADSYFPTYFSGGSDRAYNDLYAAVKNWGKYRLVPAPAQADLILEVRSIASANVSGVGGNVDTSYNPQIRLQLLDPKTRIVLWTLMADIRQGGLQKTRDARFDKAAAAIFTQLRQLSGEAVTPAEAKAAHSTAGNSTGVRVLGGLALAAVIVVPIVLFLNHRHDQPTLPPSPACTNPPFCPVP